jgi:hypothetical protein
MSQGLYTHRTRNAGEIVTDVLYNTAHRNQLNNDVPDQCGALSDDLTEFQTTLDPAPGGVVNQVISILEEFEQIRFVLADIKTALNGGTPVAWYVPVDLTAAAQKGRGARVNRSTSQSINNNTHTACIFDTVMFDTGVVGPTTDPFFVIGQPTRLTAPVPGLYQINGFVDWNSSLGNVAAVYIRINSGKILAVTQFAPDGAATATWQAVSTQYELVANDYVELIVHQLSGGAFSVTYSDFALELLNPTAVIAPPNQFTLTVAEVGTGSGTITSNVGPINCPGTCSAAYTDGDVVLLTATPTVGGFVQWEGADVPIGHETDNPLSVTMDQARTINARFTAYSLSISEAGTGAGTVTSDIGGISCPGTCSALYAPGDTVQLTAAATVGSFTGWTGDLVSTTNPDSILMDSDKTVVANFAMTGVLASLFVSAAITGTRFIAPTSVGAISGTESQVQFKLPIDVTLISLSVTMAAALAVGQTCSFRFRMAGVDDNTIVASLVATDIEKQADGSIFVPADTLITIKAVQAGGVSNLLQSLTVVYQPAA